MESFGRIQLWGDLMQIRRVDAQDAGRYICRASNQVGEQRAETHLSVTSKLNARIQPRVQVDLCIYSRSQKHFEHHHKILGVVLYTSCKFKKVMLMPGKNYLLIFNN